MEEIPTRQRYQIIDDLIKNDNNELNILWLCKYSCVSRSGYYSWKTEKNNREIKENQDREDFELILNAYKFRGFDKGSRGIHMRLLHQGIIMNRKKIQRLMRKYNLFCPIRKPNPYRQMLKDLREAATADNLVNREF